MPVDRICDRFPCSCEKCNSEKRSFMGGPFEGRSELSTITAEPAKNVLSSSTSHRYPSPTTRTSLPHAPYFAQPFERWTSGTFAESLDEDILRNIHGLPVSSKSEHGESNTARHNGMTGKSSIWADLESTNNYFPHHANSSPTGVRQWLEQTYTTGERATASQLLPYTKSYHAGDQLRTPPTTHESKLSTTQGQKSDKLPLQCDNAGCTFTCRTNRELTHHRRNHTPKDERPHACSQCSERFLYPKDLSRHLSKHQEERSFRCPVKSCKHFDKGFGRPDHLKRHCEAKHKGTLELPSSRPLLFNGAQDHSTKRPRAESVVTDAPRVSSPAASREGDTLTVNSTSPFPDRDTITEPRRDVRDVVSDGLPAIPPTLDDHVIESADSSSEVDSSSTTTGDLGSAAESNTQFANYVCHCLHETCYAEVCPPEDPPSESIIARYISKIQELLNAAKNGNADGQSSSAVAGAKTRTKEAGRSRKSSQPSKKRRRRNEDEEGEGEGSPLGFDNRGSKKRKRKLRFACPVGKFDPLACMSAFWVPYKRFCDVKQHLQRHHVDGSGRFKPCVGTSKTYEEMDRDLELPASIGEEDRWRICYRSLYPETTEVPSPYLDTDPLSLLEENAQLRNQLRIANTELTNLYRENAQRRQSQGHELEGSQRRAYESTSAHITTQAPLAVGQLEHVMPVSRNDSAAAVFSFTRDGNIPPNGMSPYAVPQSDWAARAPTMFVSQPSALIFTDSGNMQQPISAQNSHVLSFDIDDFGSVISTSMELVNAGSGYTPRVSCERSDLSLPSHPYYLQQTGLYQQPNVRPSSDEGYGTGSSGIVMGPHLAPSPRSAMQPDRGLGNESQDYDYPHKENSELLWGSGGLFGNDNVHGSYDDPEL